MAKRFSLRRKGAVKSQVEVYRDYHNSFMWSDPIYVTRPGFSFLMHIIDTNWDRISSATGDPVDSTIRNRVAWANLLLDNKSITRGDYVHQTNEMYNNGETTSDHHEAEVFLASLYAEALVDKRHRPDLNYDTLDDLRSDD